MTDRSSATALSWEYGVLSVERRGAMLAPALFVLPDGRQVAPFQVAPWFSEPNFRRYDKAIKESWIPLFVLGLEPRLNRAYGHPVSLFDVAPTVLELANVRAAHSFVGKNIFDENAKRWFTFSVPGEGRVFFASGENFTLAGGQRARLRKNMTLEHLEGHDPDLERWELIERFLLRSLVVERSLVPFGYHARLE